MAWYARFRAVSISASTSANWPRPARDHSIVSALLRQSPSAVVSVANEPDTNAWYREALKAVAYPMVGRLAPVVAVLCDRPETANEPRKWEVIAQGGTPALRAWVKEHGLARDIGDCVGSVGPFQSTPHAIAHDGAERIEKPPIPADIA